MDKRFNEWIIRKHEQLDPKEKQFFLKFLKFEPSVVLECHIRACFYSWVTEVGSQMKIMVVVYDFKRQTEEILELLKNHFAREMMAVTQ